MNKIFNEEVCLYIIFGIITSIINILVFYLLNIVVDYKISNIIALVITKLTAYILNKRYVFKSKCENYGELIKEFISFIVFRGITLLIDYIGLIILVEVINVDKLVSKIVVTILVVIINYVTNKKYVFNKDINE